MKATLGLARVGALGAACAAVALGGAAMANHSWGTYAWSYTGTPLSVPVVDNTDLSWNGYVNKAVNDWNQSAVINAPLQKGSADPACSMELNTIQVCNDNYGSTGWLGIATISLSGGKISAGSTKLNDYYFDQPNYNTYSWRQLVTCQEIGHDYGLGHQNENFNTDETTSCMEYTSWPADNESPDQHDYDQLLTIYQGGGDGGGTKPGKGAGGGNGKGKNRVSLPNVGNTPATWGRPVGRLPNGVANKFEREVNGVKFVTHVTWTLEYLEKHGNAD